jgi:hypothetical protein
VATAKDAITEEMLGELRSALDEAARSGPPTKILSRTETIAALRKQLAEMRASGWSYGELAELLGRKGLKISAATLQTYLRQKKRPAPSPRTPENNNAGAAVGVAGAPQ